MPEPVADVPTNPRACLFAGDRTAPEDPQTGVRLIDGFGDIRRLPGSAHAAQAT
jgi:hypothetical protein